MTTYYTLAKTGKRREAARAAEKVILNPKLKIKIFSFSVSKEK